MLSPKLYTAKYFKSIRCEGYYEFTSNELSAVKKIEIDLLNLKPTDKVIDIGCGRGDIVHFLYEQGISFYGVDYASSAVKLTKDRLPSKYHSRILQSDARHIALPDKSFTKVVLGDIIEHMTYSEAVEVINESFRLLKPGGTLVIHTAPNTRFKNYVYPLIRLVIMAAGYKNTLRLLDENIIATKRYHVDEYSILDLKRVMNKSLFRHHSAWVHRDALRNQTKNYLNPLKSNPLIKAGVFVINNSPLIYFFGNDLFVVATK